jgi:hypothetical protein
LNTVSLSSLITEIKSYSAGIEDFNPSIFGYFF